MKQQITFNKQLRPILYPIIATIIFTLFFIELFIEAWYTEFREFSIIVYIIFIGYTFIIPIYIHKNYLNCDKGKTLEFDADRKHLILKKDSQVLVNDNLEKINKIEVHQTTGYKQRTINWFSWSAYYYYKLVFNDGKIIYITRLMMKDLEKELQISNVKYFNHLVPVIPLFK